MPKQLIPNIVLAELQKNPKIGRVQLAQNTGITQGEARYYCKIFKDQRKTLQCIGRGVALFDIHYPEHDQAAINVVLAFMKDFKPDYLVLGGDQLQMDTISFFNKNKPKLTESKRLKSDYKGFQTQILDKIDQNVPKKCKKYFLIGNHEYRIERLIENSPQHEGFIELENNLNLKDYTIVPFNTVVNIGEMYFTHGWHYNIHYAKQTVQEAQKMIFVGHAHMPQVYTAISPVTYLPKQCVGLGCLCNRNPQYMENRPNAWVHQFLFWYLFEDGTFTYYTPIILNGRCIINGKIYNGN
jgi:predicted phosphodiesterase